MVIEAAAFGAASAFCLGGLEVRRERRQVRASRRDILAPCRDVLDGASIGSAPDGYPTLSGRANGRAVRLSLIPDTLAPRRLPQLWLALSATSASAAALVLTARPRGDDYLAANDAPSRHLPVPSWLPEDFAVRGGTDAAVLLTRLRSPLQDAFADPLVKELALAPGRLRLLYRLGEGRRGAHLLLRQASFDAVLAPARLERLLGLVGRVEAALASEPATC